MKRLIILIFAVYLSSCNPQLHIVGVGMRHHNLSQNKFQPDKHRKKVNLGRNLNSPVFWILRNR